MKKSFTLKISGLVLFFTFLIGTSNVWSQILTYGYTGSVQTYLVPPGVTTMKMELWGAAGYGDLGYGGKVEAIVSVTPGSTLNIFVGGAGGPTTGGYNGGGVPGVNATYGGGGGATDIRVDGIALTDRIIVAGGGGGSGSNCGTWTAEGGHGGGLIGESACLYSCSDCQYTGKGGSQVAGGIAGPTAHGSCTGNTNGSLGQGGSNTLNGYGTGGGGGYYGGGSGCFEGAGGGSSFTQLSAIDVVHTVGANNGNGKVVMEILCKGLVTSIPVTGVCLGDKLTLDAKSVTGGTITWVGPELALNGVPFVPSEGTHKYTALSSSPDDCNFSIMISATKVPEIKAHADTEAACEGTEITVFGTGGDTYTWTGSGDIDPINGVPFTAEGGTNTYTVIGSILGCKGPADKITLVGAPMPIVTATATPTFVCLGESYSLSATGAVGYKWGGGITEGAPIMQTEPGTYTHIVIGVSDVGCGDTTAVTVIVNPPATVNAGTDITVCKGDAVTLNATGVKTYVWSPMATNGVPFTPLTSVTYTVTGTDENGCKDTDDILVTVIDVPKITGAVITDEFFGDDGAIDITVIGGSGNYIYTWSNGMITEDITGLSAGTYKVQVDDIKIKKGQCPTDSTFTLASFVNIESEGMVDFKVYPSPTTDNITIQLEGEFNYEVTSIKGEVIFTGAGFNTQLISLENVANGTYIVKVTTQNNSDFVKVVKH